MRKSQRTKPALDTLSDHRLTKYSKEQIEEAIKSLHVGTKHYMENPHLAPKGILWNNYFRFKIHDRFLEKTLKKIQDYDGRRDYFEDLLDKVRAAKIKSTTA